MSNTKNNNNNFKELYPRLKLSFEKAKEWLIHHLDSDVFKRRENASNTISSVPILQEIIRHNMITENSQEGIISRGYNEDSKKFYVIKERAYLSGFMKHGNANKLVNYINTYTDKVAFIVAVVPSDIYESIETSRIAVTIQASAKLAENANDFTIASIVPQFFGTDEFNFTKTLSNLKDDVKVDLVMCFDPQYGRLASSKNGLYADVLKGLQKN